MSARLIKLAAAAFMLTATSGAFGYSDFYYYGHGFSEVESVALDQAMSSAWWQSTLTFHYFCEMTSTSVQPVGGGYYAEATVRCQGYL